MKTLRYFCSFTALVFLGCSSKESPSDFVDYETVEKDDAFRAAVEKENFVKLSDGYTYYEYENKNADTVLVMVHGFSVPSYIWDSTYYAARARGYGVLRYDTYGRGYSDNPDTHYDVVLYARQLTELLDTLQVKPGFNLLGLSDGARTITAFAAEYPERITNLIYVDPTGFATITEGASTTVGVTPAEILAFKKERYGTMAKGQMTDFYDSIPFKGWDTRYEELMRSKGFVRALISTTKNNRSLEKEHRAIAASGVPVFAMWGAYDNVVKLDEVRANLMDRIPGVQLTIIPNAGHLPHMEQALIFNGILFDRIICGKVARAGIED